MRRLVTALLVVLIVGFVTIVFFLVQGLRTPDTDTFTLPEARAALKIPVETQITSIGTGDGHILIVTTNAQGQEHLYIYESKTLTLERTVPIIRATAQ